MVRTVSRKVEKSVLIEKLDKKEGLRTRLGWCGAPFCLTNFKQVGRKIHVVIPNKEGIEDVFKNSDEKAILEETT